MVEIIQLIRRKTLQFIGLLKNTSNNKNYVNYAHIEQLVCVGIKNITINIIYGVCVLMWGRGGTTDEIGILTPPTIPHQKF